MYPKAKLLHRIVDNNDAVEKGEEVFVIEYDRGLVHVMSLRGTTDGWIPEEWIEKGE